jgi:hypothetical protein
MNYRGADTLREMAGDCFLHIIRFLHNEYDETQAVSDIQK